MFYCLCDKQGDQIRNVPNFFCLCADMKVLMVLAVAVLSGKFDVVQFIIFFAIHQVNSGLVTTLNFLLSWQAVTPTSSMVTLQSPKWKC